METTFVHFGVEVHARSIEELDKELAQIRSRALTAFGTRGTPVKTTTPGTTRGTPVKLTKSAARTRGTRTRTRAAAPQRLRGSARARTGNGHVSDEQMLSAIEGRNGITGKELAEQLGISHNTALRKLSQWEKSGKAFREGTRNKTRWFARQPAMVT